LVSPIDNLIVELYFRYDLDNCGKEIFDFTLVDLDEKEYHDNRDEEYEEKINRKCILLEDDIISLYRRFYRNRQDDVFKLEDINNFTNEIQKIEKQHLFNVIKITKMWIIYIIVDDNHHPFVGNAYNTELYFKYSIDI